MKNNTGARLFFVFIAYFLMAMLLGGITAFFSMFGISVIQKSFYFLFSENLAYFLEKILLPAAAFAIPCAILCIGQFFLTIFLNLALRDKIMVFAAMCLASYFCSNAFMRYTGEGFFSLYPMRWLPCEISAFIAGIAALMSFYELEQETADEENAAGNPQSESK
ncbi:MAG: hypothetical protein J5706_09185 [Elusimicrobiales bacterium]|nr:hypothetical protein [Elusimicrobiales bacterium]